ncbi:MAG: TetR/AcrR family transcriptional regulator [Aeromicrobium sp.]
MSTELPQRRRFPQAVRREQLLDVAEDLFVAHGYAAVTMEDIARAAGVTRPLPYNHFGSKEGVYIACVLRASDAYNATLVAAVDPASDPRDQLRQGADVFFDMLQNDRGRWMLIFASSSVLPKESAAELGEVRRSTIAAIELLLRQAAPQASAARMAAAAHAVSGVGEQLGLWWLANPSLSKAEVMGHYTELLWSGLAPYTQDVAPLLGH